MNELTFLHPDPFKARVALSYLRELVEKFETPIGELDPVRFRVPAFTGAIITELAALTHLSIGHVTAALFDAGAQLSLDHGQLGKRLEFNNELRVVERDDTVRFEDFVCEMPSMFRTLLLRETLIAQRTTADRWLAATIQTAVWAAITAADRCAPPLREA